MVGLGVGSRLLVNLKSHIVALASSANILQTMQLSAQATLKVGWSVLLPTPQERAKALSSLLPNSGLESSGGITQGQRFMMDLLVSSLMADGGLESALESAILSEITDPPEQGTSRSCDSSIPLLHLIKQLLRNGSYATQLRLQNTSKNQLSKEISPSLNLLLRFQRLLVSKMYAKNQDNVLGAESLLKKYLQYICNHVVETLVISNEHIVTNSKNYAVVMQSLKGDISGKLAHH